MKNTWNLSQGQQLLHCFLLDPSVYISLVATLKGDITTEEIEQAVKKAYTQNETTMSKIVLEDGNAYFEKMNETGCKVFVDTRDWLDIMHVNEKDTFRIHEGELFRIFILPDAAKQEYTLFLMAHHIIGDGKSLLLMLEDILANLSGKEVEYRPLNNNGAILPHENLRPPFIVRSSIKMLNRMWKKQEKVFGWEDYFYIHNQFWKNRKSDIRVETREKDELVKIKATCKELGITVNSYMITEVLKKHPEYENFSLTLSIRGDNRSISNKVSSLRLEYTYDTQKNFLENAKQVHALIKENLNDDKKKFSVFLNVKEMDHNLLDASLMYTHTGYQNKAAEILAGRIGYCGESRTRTCVTNLNNIQMQSDYGKFRLEQVFGIAASMSAVENVICVGSYQNKMTIVYTNIVAE